MPNDLDTERFTLRQAARAGDDFSQILDEPDFAKSQLARLPTRTDQAFAHFRISSGSAVVSAALGICWFETS